MEGQVFAPPSPVAQPSSPQPPHLCRSGAGSKALAVLFSRQGTGRRFVPQFPYQVDGSVLQAFYPDLLEPLVTHMHGSGEGTQRVPRGTLAEHRVSVLSPELLVPVLLPRWALQLPGWKLVVRGGELNPSLASVTRRRPMLSHSDWGSCFTGRLGAGQEFFR